MIYFAGSTSNSIDLMIVDDSGLAVTGLVAATFPTLTYSLAGANADVAFPALSDLAALTTAYASGGVKERGNGYYRADIPNGAFSAGGVVAIRGEASGKHILCERLHVVAYNPQQTIEGAVWDALTANHIAANTYGLDVGQAFGYIKQLNLYLISISMTVNDAAPTTSSFKTFLSNPDNFWNGQILSFTTGVLAGQSRVITTYLNLNGKVTFNEPFTAAPTTGDMFIIGALRTPTAAQIATTVWQDTTAGDFTVASSIGKSLFTGNNAPGAASGLALVGSNMGAVASVTAAVAVTSNIKKNQALTHFEFLVTDSTTHAPKTGVSLTVTRSIDGGAFGAGTLANVVEVGNGIYAVDFGAGDLNGNVIMLRATAAGADDVLERIITQP